MQRTRIFRCPGKDLIDLVRALNPREFPFLSIEPGRDESDEVLRGLNPIAIELELDNFYREYTQEYGKRQNVSFKLFQYDDKFKGDWENIIYNLGQHVVKCNECSGEYHRFVSKCAERALRMEVSRKTTTDSRRNNIVCIRKLYDDFVREIDKKHLKLARYLFPKI